MQGPRGLQNHVSTWQESDNEVDTKPNYKGESVVFPPVYISCSLTTCTLKDA